MMKATWQKAARNVQLVLLFHLIRHQGNDPKIARHVRKVIVNDYVLPSEIIDPSELNTY